MDAEYLKETVGAPLSDALATLVTVQPADAVDYIGKYLLAYVEREEGRAAQQALYDEYARVEKEEGEKEAAAAAAAAEAKAVAEAPKPDQVELDEALSADADVPALHARVCALAKLGAGATSAYLGNKATTASEQAVINFVADTGCDMAGKTLMGAAPDAGEDGGDEGVTFKLFVGTEVEVPAPEPAEGEEPGEPTTATEYPAHLLVENVCRDSAVKMYGIPALGSYLAVPVKYTSYTHPEAVGAPPPQQAFELTPGGYF